ncbi:MAG: oxygen-dependent coproporphyrinogen oxidase [Chitinophagales bacterium]
MSKQEISTYFQQLQDEICLGLEALDGKSYFKQDLWKHAKGGGGRTRIIQNGNIFEKGGVNFSAVSGRLAEPMWKALHLTDSEEFFATGVSIVLHPESPLLPIMHMNVRYFEMANGQFWFGGGIDLTPHYVNEEDAHFFHTHLKNTCDKHHETYYPEFKKWADNYFFIPHRNETRGIGGIFFDRLSETDTHTKAERFAFVKSVGESFVDIYTYFVEKYAQKNYTEEQKTWQLVRRGRYVEFNLVYDRGTKFGLQTNGRIESILMSLPPHANWEYCFDAKENSEEAKTLTLLKKGIAWAEKCSVV